MISVSCTSAGMRVSSSTRAILPVLHGAHHRAGHQRIHATGLRPAAGRSSSRSGSLLRRCRPCPGPAGSSRRRWRRPVCSETQVLAVPGTPSSSRARSVARVAMAISIRRRLPMYLGVTSKPLSQLAAQQVGRDRPGRQLPVRRALAGIGLRQLDQLLGELLFGMFT